MGKFEITFDEYAAYQLDSNREIPASGSWLSNRLPATELSWDDAKEYCNWLNIATKKEFRLPSEAEWEYAARAENQDDFWWGNDAHKDGKVWANCGNCGEGVGQKPLPVGSFPANKFGLHDMHGNVWEWVEDDWHNSYEDSRRPDNGSPWIDNPRGSFRVVRGGGFYLGAAYCRSAFRNLNPPGGRGSGVGFRLSRSVSVGP